MTVKQITTSAPSVPPAHSAEQKQEGSQKPLSSSSTANGLNTSLAAAPPPRRSRLRRILENIFTPPWRTAAERAPSVRGGYSRLRRFFKALLSLPKRIISYFFDKKGATAPSADSNEGDKNENDSNIKDPSTKAAPITFSIDDDENDSTETTVGESPPTTTTSSIHPVHHVDTFPWPEKVCCKVEATIHVAPLINPSGTGWGIFTKLDSHQSGFTLYSLSGKGQFWRWETSEETIPDQFGVRNEGNGIYACIHLLSSTHRPKITRFHCLSPQLSPSQIVALLILAHGGRFSDPLKSVLKYKLVPKKFINNDGIEQDVLPIIRNAAVTALTFFVGSEIIPTPAIRRGYFRPIPHKS